LSLELLGAVSPQPFDGLFAVQQFAALSLRKACGSSGSYRFALLQQPGFMLESLAGNLGRLIRHFFR
jgi:hypothetical protein